MSVRQRGSALPSTSPPPPAETAPSFTMNTKIQGGGRAVKAPHVTQPSPRERQERLDHLPGAGLGRDQFKVWAWVQGSPRRRAFPVLTKQSAQHAKQVTADSTRNRSSPLFKALDAPSIRSTIDENGKAFLTTTCVRRSGHER